MFLPHHRRSSARDRPYRRTVFAALSLFLILISVCMPIFAQGQTDQELPAASGSVTDIARIRSGDPISVPVTLTCTDEWKPRSVISVVLPSELPVTIRGKTISTSKDARIENRSPNTSVKISEIRVESAALSVVAFDPFPEGVRNSIALKINGCATQGPGVLKLQDGAFPVIASGDFLPVAYHVRLTDDIDRSGLCACRVIFCIKAVEGSEQN